MLKSLLIIFLVIVEIAAIYIAIFIKDYAITSLERELAVLHETPLIYYRERLLSGIVVATVLTVVVAGIFLIFKSLKRDMFTFRTWKVFVWQWIILIIGAIIGLGLDLNYLHRINP